MNEITSVRKDFENLRKEVQPFFCLKDVVQGPNKDDKNAVLQGLADFIFQQKLPQSMISTLKSLFTS